jgi:hypothetical protein
LRDRWSTILLTTAAAWVGCGTRPHDELSRRLGRSSVFLDNRSIGPSTRFDDELAGQARACRVLLVVVGPDWERAPAPNGGRRLDDPLDWVRREIVAATEGGAWIVPVLVGTRPRRPVKPARESVTRCSGSVCLRSTTGA